MTSTRALTRAEHLAYTGAQLNTLEFVPYFAAALLRLRPVAAEGLDTFAVDAHWRLYIDPQALEDWGPVQSGAVLAHEVCHVLRDHAGRASVLPHCDHHAWNLATDASINESLLAADLPLPDGLITPEVLGLKPGQIEEEYYAALPHCTPFEHGCGSGAGDPVADWELPTGDAIAPALGPAEQHIARQQTAADVRDAASKAPGSIPAGLTRWADEELTPPTIDWRRQMRAAVRRAVTYVVGGQQDYTYSRPGRRRIPGIVTPSMHSPQPTVAVVIDTSGSMSPDDLHAALSEVTGITRATRAAMSIVSVDSAASVQTGITRADQIVLTGGGGTDMRVGISAAQSLRPSPDCILVLTDGYTPWPDEPTAQRLIIGLIGSTVDTPHWATTVHVRTV